jgi:hypothetical protein
MSVNTALQEVSNNQVVESHERASSVALIMGAEGMSRVSALAKIMASSKVTVPKHLQGNEGDCAAIVMQSMQWGMNPYAVAQKTHLVNGVLGYEAQLVNAVVQSTGAIKSNFSYEYRGDGNALECRVGAIINGQENITWGEWLKSSDVTTKNSPLWKTNPKQQMGYLQVKNWARLYCPGAILGVYTPDEIEVMHAGEIEINPIHKTGTSQAQAALPPIDQENPERNRLISELEQVAQEEGLLGYGDAWLKLTKQDRVMVGNEEHERLKAIADASPANPKNDASATAGDYQPGSDD